MRSGSRERSDTDTGWVRGPGQSKTVPSPRSSCREYRSVGGRTEKRKRPIVPPESVHGPVGVRDARVVVTGDDGPPLPRQGRPRRPGRDVEVTTDEQDGARRPPLGDTVVARVLREREVYHLVPRDSDGGGR